MNFLWWGKEKDVGIYTEEFYENQRLERAKQIATAPTREEADKIVEQFKLSHPGEWIENDDGRNYQPDGHYQLRPFTLSDIGKYFIGTIDDGYCIRRRIEIVAYCREYGFIPGPFSKAIELDVLSCQRLKSLTRR